jgi:hypothetical protein
MIFITKKEYIEDYFNNPTYLSQSQGKALVQGPEAYLALLDPEKKMYYEEPKDYFIIGSAVDCLLTQGLDAFENEYYIATCLSKPTDKQISIIRQALDIAQRGWQVEYEDIPAPLAPETPIPFNEWLENQESDYFYSLIIEACNSHEYQMKWGSDARYKAVMANNDEYVNDLILSQGKQIITPEEHDTITMCFNSLKSNDDISEYLKNDSYVNDEHLHIFFQCPIFFLSYEVKMKGLIDMLVINTFNRTITAYDFKTIRGELFEFPGSVFTYGYDIQAAWYNCGLRSLVNTDKHYFERIIEQGTFDVVGSHNIEMLTINIDKYNVDRFKFAVVKTKSPYTSKVFTCSTELLTNGEQGYEESYYETVTPTGKLFVKRASPAKLGVKQIATLYKYYQTTHFTQDFRENQIVQGNILINPIGFEKEDGGEQINPYQQLFK